jgi:hypothetical protein
VSAKIAAQLRQIADEIEDADLRGVTIVLLDSVSLRVETLGGDGVTREVLEGACVHMNEAVGRAVSALNKTTGN